MGYTRVDTRRCSPTRPLVRVLVSIVLLLRAESHANCGTDLQVRPPTTSAAEAEEAEVVEATTVDVSTTGTTSATWTAEAEAFEGLHLRLLVSQSNIATSVNDTTRRALQNLCI